MGLSERSSEAVKIMIDEAVGFLGEDKPLHAMQILRRIISRDPGYADAYLKLAEIYLGLHNYDAAEKLLLEGLEILPEDYKLAYALGSFYFNVGEMDRALPLLRKLTAWRNPSVHLALATIYLDENSYEEAASEVRLVLKTDAKYPDANGLLGRVYLKQNDFPNAIKYLKRELGMNESSVEFRLDIATAYYMMGDLREALEEFTLLIDTDPDFYPGWLMCGKILLEMGKTGESEFYLTRALSINPRSAEVLQTLANLYSTIGEDEKARTIFDELAEANAIIEDDAEALERFSRINRKRNKR